MFITSKRLEPSPCSQLFSISSNNYFFVVICALALALAHPSPASLARRAAKASRFAFRAEVDILTSFCGRLLAFLETQRSAFLFVVARYPEVIFALLGKKNIYNEDPQKTYS